MMAMRKGDERAAGQMGKGRRRGAEAKEYAKKIKSQANKNTKASEKRRQ